MSDPKPLEYARRDASEAKPPSPVFAIVRWSIYLMIFLVLEGLIVFLIIRSPRPLPPMILFVLPAFFAALIVLCVHQIWLTWKRYRDQFDQKP